MVKESTQNTVGVRFKKELMVVAFVLSLLALFWGGITLNSYIKFGQYRTLATELNETLGGGYRTSYNWNCSIESANCPSVRMIKDADFKDNDEARAVLEEITKKITEKGFAIKERGTCEPIEGLPVYCSTRFAKNGLLVNVSMRKDFVGVDIQP